MRLQSLIHLVAAIRALCHPVRVIVLGSSALLASFPEIGETSFPGVAGQFRLSRGAKRI
jgi:hypothetical protein